MKKELLIILSLLTILLVFTSGCKEDPKCDLNKDGKITELEKQACLSGGSVGTNPNAPNTGSDNTNTRPNGEDDTLGAGIGASVSVENCEEIDWDIQRWQCYHALAIERNDESICLNIPYEGPKATAATSTRIGCIKDLAVQKLDSTICELIRTEDKDAILITTNHQGCVEDAGIAMNDASVCLGINIFNDLGCVSDVADKTNDPSKCDLIRQTEYYKKFGELVGEGKLDDCKEDAIED